MGIKMSQLFCADNSPNDNSQMQNDTQKKNKNEAVLKQEID